jgi:hypothetical protein
MFERGSDKRSGEGGRMAGDDLQSMVFWQQACRLFTEPDTVELVAYSDGELRAFDDVVTYYCPGTQVAGEAVRADCYQVKFNMRGCHPITAENLIEPSALGRKKRSLLDDLVTLFERGQEADAIYRPILRSTWSPQHGDALDNVWLRTDGRLATEDIISAKPGTKIGRAVGKWVDYLDKWQVEELEPILRHFRISPVGDLESQRCSLNTVLRNAGLQPIDQNHRSNQYDDLVRKLVEDGHHRFDQDGLRQILEDEGLVVGRPIPNSGRLTVGVRTFARGSEHMAHLDRCLDMRCLFEGRHIKSEDAWSRQVAPAIEDLVRELSLIGGVADIDLSATHSSIAFLIGRLLDAKSGVCPTVVQRTGRGVERWAPPGPPQKDLPAWEVESTAMSSHTDIAVAVSAMHEVDDDVRSYISGGCHGIGQLISFNLPGHTGRAAIQSGQHAHQLTDQLVREVRAHRKPGVKPRVHVFGAAPNALMFCLGQASRALGECQLYEYDFESSTLGAYMPSLLVGD